MILQFSDFVKSFLRILSYRVTTQKKIFVKTTVGKRRKKRLTNLKRSQWMNTVIRGRVSVSKIKVTCVSSFIYCEVYSFLFSFIETKVIIVQLRKRIPNIYCLSKYFVAINVNMYECVAACNNILLIRDCCLNM